MNPPKHKINVSAEIFKTDSAKWVCEKNKRLNEK
jgi:hypothetical protein